METLTDAVGLRGPGPGFGMLNVIDGQVQLVIVMFHLGAVLGAPVRQDAQQGQGLLLKEGKHPVIQQVG